MNDVNKLSERVIEYAERMSAMADAAQGKKQIRSRGTSRWLLLPVAGAGLYAMARSKTFARQAKGAANEAKSLASELPDELLKRVRQTSQPARTSPSANGGSSRRRTNSSARTKPRRTKATSR